MDLYNEYPKSMNIIREWVLNKMTETSNEVPEEFIEEVKKRVDEMINEMIELNPRNLFDLFDSHNLYIIIRKYEKSDNTAEFRYVILPRDIRKEYGISDSRKETEKLAIIDAIKTLEDKL